MFTGIVEEIGIVRSVTPFGEGLELRVEAATVLQDVGLGDSIAIDGVCQTVVSFDPHRFTVQAIATTLERTTFSALRVGSRVNLERAAALGDRLGGHLVQGHVDGVGEVTSVRRESELTRIDFTVPEEVDAVTVLHGSITVQGVSLTVNELPAPGRVQVSIIPFTREHTTLGSLREGDRVNLEGDLVGRYVRHLLSRPGEGRRSGSGLDPDLLRGWGY